MRIRRAAIAAALALCLAPAAVFAAIAGRVVGSKGAPVDGARVEDAASGATAFTDARGRFELAAAEPPLVLRVSHPRYFEREVAIDGAAAEPLEIALEAKQQIFEEVVVSASRGEGGAVPVSIAATLVEPGAAAVEPATLAELVATVPGVAENGQGGMFQTYSVRGVARQRVLTLFSGMRIVGERRAGVSASFVDPRLLRSVDVLRGPSSTYYGSGALGGVVQLFPRAFDGAAAEAGWRSAGDESYVVAGWGDERWSLGLARRQSGRGRTPAGETLNDGFEQASAVLEREWEGGGRTWTLLAVASEGRDIGKSSTEFPERITIYPQESHLLVKLAVASAAGWRLEAFAHPNDLETRVEESAASGGGGSTVRNEAFDFGLNWQRELELRPGVTSRLGIDLFGRRSVTADEVERAPLAGGGLATARSRTLDGAHEDEAGLYGAVEWQVGQATLLAGGRLAWQRQENGGDAGDDDTAWSAFGGLVVPLGGGFELAANAGRGLRFPSLGERFFSGTTGRGTVVGNRDLEPERSLNLDVGLRWFGQSLFLTGYLFRTEIHDYIERIEVEPDVLAFVNLTSGEIVGVELEGQLRVGSRWNLAFGAHALEGRDAADVPLADVPADRLFLGAGWRHGRWRTNGRWEARAAKRDPGSGEKAIPAAHLVSLSVAFDWTERLSLNVGGRNLLDEEYFNSADRKVPLSPGRALSAGISWRAR